MSGNLISDQLFYSVATFLRWGIVVRVYETRWGKKGEKKRKGGKKKEREVPLLFVGYFFRGHLERKKNGRKDRGAGKGKNGGIKRAMNTL